MRRSKYTRPAWLGEQGEGGQGTADKPRLTTSAMIASLAGADQRTKPAPFGHALVELAETRPEIVGMTADLGKYTDLHIFAQGPSRPLLPDGHGRAAADAAPPPAWRAKASCRSPPPTRCSRRAGPTTSSAWRSPRRTSTSRSCCALPGLTTGYGPSHQATEDIAIFRGMPNLTIVDPCDAHRDRAGRAGHRGA